MRAPRRSLALLVALVALSGAAALWSARVSAHSEPPPAPPAPPVPLAGANTPTATPVRWSWVHWWEANRDAYLAPPSQGEPIQDRDQATDDGRGRAITALLTGLKDQDPWTRAWCAYALGSIRAESAAGPLVGLIGTERSARTRQYLLLALGMVGSSRTQRAILDRSYPTNGELAAGIFGLGLAPMLIPLSSTRLVDLPRDADGAPMIGSTLWAARQHAIPVSFDLARNAVLHSESPWVVSEALCTLGRLGDPRGQEILVGVARATDAAQQLPVWLLLEDVADDKERLAHEAAQEGRPPLSVIDERWAALSRRVFVHRPALPDLGVTFAPPPADRSRVLGVEAIYMERLRCAAIIGLGHVPTDASVDALRAVLNEEPTDVNTVTKCFAAISLGRLGAPAAVQDLMDIVDARRARSLSRREFIDSPLRGFAALALGLYARPAPGPQGTLDRPRSGPAIELLGARLADPGETAELRSAAAMALGLTSRTEILKGLITISSTVGPEDMPLAGYVVLARALLGDRSVVEPARRILEIPAHRDETTYLLTRRAAVLALGLQGSDEVLPLLVKAWDDVYFVNREVILALSFCAPGAVVDRVLDRLASSNSTYERAFMARVLARLFAPRPPSVSRFTARWNLPLRDDRIRAYGGLSNEFLAVYLLQRTEEPWY